MLLLWAGATVGASGVESLLFSRYGPQSLPYLFIALGLITLPITAQLGALLQRTDRRRILILLPLALGLALAAGRGLILADGNWVYPVLWVLMMVVWIIEATGMWAVASLVNDTRQAKRLFPLYGAGQIMGGAVGGLLTVPLARTLHAENLILVWTVALVAAAVLVRSLLASESTGEGGPTRITRATSTNVLRSALDGFRLVRSSRLLGWLAVALVLFALLYNSLSFVFAEAVTDRFPNSDALAAFIGLFNALINGPALIVSIFVANRLFARLGVATMVLTLAVIYLVGFAASAIGVGFAALAAFRLIQMVWVNSVWITGWQTLFTIIPPERRGQVTSFMDGGAWQVGVMLAGGAIILSQVLRGDEAVFLVGIAGSMLLVVAMVCARRAYGPAVAEAVRAGRPDVFSSADEPFGGFRTDGAAVATLVQSAMDSDADVRRLAVAIAAEVDTREVLPAILAGASDADPEVSAVALASLARHPDPSGSTVASQAISHPDATVRAHAIDALVACASDPGWVEARLGPLLADSDPGVRARAAAGLVRVRPSSGATDRVVEMIRSPEPATRAAAVAALGELGERADLVEQAVTDADAGVRKASLRALAAVGHDGHKALVSALGDSDAGVREAAVATLTSLGSEVVDLLEDALENPLREAGALRTLRIIGGANYEHLRGYAHAQVLAAAHYAELARGLDQSADERIELLAYSLRMRMTGHATNALWANASLSDANGLGPAIESLTSPNPRQRATALEALESLGEPEIVRPLLALWEREQAQVGDLAHILDELFAEDDPWLRACAVLACESLPARIFDGRLRELSITDPDPDVRSAAATALEGDKDMKTLDTLPLMKRVLFLRKVPLFAELTPSDLNSVAKAAEENLYPSGELIAAQGEPGGEMHVVVSGVIEVGVADSDDRLELARREPGEVVGEMSVITGQPRMASLIAVGDVRTLSIDRARFERILAERPEVSLAVMRQLCARLEQQSVEIAPSAR
ncbi:MAG: Npt1/Npt2 family nucleotide transporter [Actinomycetota bacterium]